MSVLSLQKDTSTAIAENTEIFSDWGDRIHRINIAMALEKIHSLPSVRRKKILEVRRKLVEGRYNLERRLDVALDRLLEDLTT